MSREIRERLPKINRRPRSGALGLCRVAPINLVTVDAVGIRRFCTGPFYFWSRAPFRSKDEVLFARKDEVDSLFRIPCALCGPSPERHV